MYGRRFDGTHDDDRPGEHTTAAARGLAETRAPHLHRPGEPQLRSVLRHLPRRRRHPDQPRRLVLGLRAGQVPGGRLRTALRHTIGRPGRRPAQPRRSVARCERGQDERVHRLASRTSDEVLDGPHSPGVRRAARAGGTARRDEHAVAARDPQLLGLRRPLRPAGRDVRTGRLLDAARTPVPRVGVVGRLLEPRRPDVVPVRHQPEPGGEALGLRREAALCVDRRHVAPRRAGRLVAVLRRQRHL